MASRLVVTSLFLACWFTALPTSAVDVSRANEFSQELRALRSEILAKMSPLQPLDYMTLYVIELRHGMSILNDTVSSIGRQYHDMWRQEVDRLDQGNYNSQCRCNDDNTNAEIEKLNYKMDAIQKDLRSVLEEVRGRDTENRHPTFNEAAVVPKEPIPYEPLEVSNKRPIVADNHPVVPDEPALVPSNKHPIVADNHPVVPDEPALVPSNKHPIVADDHSVVPDEPPVTSRNVPVVSDESPVEPDKPTAEPVAPDNSSVVTAELPISTNKPPVVPDKSPGEPEELKLPANSKGADMHQMENEAKYALRSYTGHKQWKNLKENLEQVLNPTSDAYKELANISPDDATPLRTLASKGNVKLLEEMLNMGLPIDAMADDYWRYNLLSAAAMRGQVDMVRLLLDRGAKTEVTNNHGVTPLMFAASMNHLPVVDLLVKRGADLDRRNRDGNTALDLARKRGKTAAVEYLEAIMDDGSNQ